MGRRQALDRDHPRSLTNACSTCVHILLLFRRALLMSQCAPEHPCIGGTMYQRPPSVSGNSVRPLLALSILWGNLVWVIVLCLNVIWLAFFNLFQDDLLGDSKMWSRYVSSPFRLLDGIIIITIIGWLLRGLFNCRSKQGLQHRTLVVVGYTIYVLATSPIPVALMNYIRTGCWSDQC